MLVIGKATLKVATQIEIVYGRWLFDMENIRWMDLRAEQNSTFIQRQCVGLCWCKRSDIRTGQIEFNENSKLW